MWVRSCVWYLLYLFFLAPRLFISICFNSSYIPKPFQLSTTSNEKLRTHNGNWFRLLFFPFCHFNLWIQFRLYFSHLFCFLFNFSFGTKAVLFLAVSSFFRLTHNTRLYFFTYPWLFSSSSSNDSSSGRVSPIKSLNKGDRIQCYTKWYAFEYAWNKHEC